MTSILPSLADIDRLLLVKTSSIGDVIHALPVAQALKEARPTLTLGWVVRARCADVLLGNPWIDHLYVLPDKPSLRDLLQLRRTLHAAGYQITLDMQGLLLSGLLTWLSGAPVRLGWDRNREQNARFLTHALVPGKDVTRPEVEALYGFTDVLDVPVPRGVFPPQNYLAEEGRRQAEEWLAPLPYPRIALNVGASRVYKRWPTEFWTILADTLAAQKIGLVFIGNETDADVVAQVQRQMQNHEGFVNLAGRTSLRALASVLAACDLVVSGDTGPMHLAVAVGTPVVALFGGTDPRRHGPYGANNTVLHRPQPNGTPSRRPTDDYGIACMRALTPQDTLDAVEALLAERPSHA